MPSGVGEMSWRIAMTSSPDRWAGDSARRPSVPDLPASAISPSGVLLASHEQRLAFFDDVGGELRRLAGTDVAHRVGCTGGDEKDLAGFQCDRRLTIEGILQRTFDDIDDLFARMGVPRKRYSRIELDEHLVDLASGHAEIVALKVGALHPLLGGGDVRRQKADGD